MQGCVTPPLPRPPRGIPSLLVKWVISLSFGLVAFPVFSGGLVWPCPLPPCKVGPVVVLVVPAPPVGGSVFHRGMVAAAC